MRFQVEHQSLTNHISESCFKYFTSWVATKTYDGAEGDVMPLAAASTVGRRDALTQAHHPHASFLAPGKMEKKERMRVWVRGRCRF